MIYPTQGHDPITITSTLMTSDRKDAEGLINSGRSGVVICCPVHLLYLGDTRFEARQLLDQLLGKNDFNIYIPPMYGY